MWSISEFAFIQARNVFHYSVTMCIYVVVAVSMLGDARQEDDNYIDLTLAVNPR